MSTPEVVDKPVKPAQPDVFDPNLQYRSVNRAAVASVFLFLLGLTSLMFPQLLLLPLAGILLGYSGYRTIKRYPDEYTGLNLARFGMTFCLLLLVGGASYHGIVYATEVPEGHERISFAELQPDGFIPDVPKRAKALQGQKVFIKGYVHPGVAGMGPVNQFVLVPDMGTCCFGGQPKPTDMILVHTTPEARQSYSTRIVKLAGKFDIGDQLEDFAGVKNVLYRLDSYKAK